MNLYWREQGLGPNVLLVHGTGANADFWGEVPSMISPDFRAISYDLRGCSRSPGPPLPGLSPHVQDAIDLLREVSAGPAILVGWSSGGFIAIELALQRPELVSGLVLIEPVVNSVATAFDPSLQAIVAQVQLLRVTRGNRAAACAFFRWAMRDGKHSSRFDSLSPEMRQSLENNSAAALAAMRRPLETIVSRRRLSTVSCQVICIEGDRGQRYNRRAARYVTSAIPAAQLITAERSTHTVALDRPDVIVAAIRECAAWSRGQTPA